ncbi:unnamed protein product, partial [marine sediment metagenome]
RNLKNEDLEGKKRTDLLPLLSSLKIVNQEPINIDLVKSLNGEIHFTKDSYEIFNSEGLKIIASGEIPRNHIEEDFNNFFSLQEDTLKIDKILDDKCLILEFDENIVLLNGCCHSGLMNTLDYTKTISNKPVSHIIGGIHMAGASDQRILNTLDYLKKIDKYRNEVFVFPMHCSGEKFRQLATKYESAG